MMAYEPHAPAAREAAAHQSLIMPPSSHVAHRDDSRRGIQAHLEPFPFIGMQNQRELITCSILVKSDPGFWFVTIFPQVHIQHFNPDGIRNFARQTCPGLRRYRPAFRSESMLLRMEDDV